jgi:hypothetical protein
LFYENALYGDVSRVNLLTNVRDYNRDQTNLRIEFFAAHYLHFPNGNDFFMYSKDHSIDWSGSIYKWRLHNPFRGFKTVSSVKPRCIEWLCVSVSVFKENSYLKLYYLDEIEMRRHMNETNYGQYYKNPWFYKDTSSGYNVIKNLEELASNYTIHTFSVLNVTGQVDYFDFTDDLLI